MNPDDLLAACDGFEWDDGNAPKVVARHSVQPSECEQIFFGRPLLVAEDLAHSQHELRWRVLGTTTGGRPIYLVFTVRGTKIRVLAARTMNRKERREYEQAKARAEADPEL